MNLITILEEGIKANHRKHWYVFLTIQKYLVEKHFTWLNLQINSAEKSIIGKGILNIESKKYTVLLSYSPFHKYRYDRIYIDDEKIKYHADNHLYADNSLCLYHPLIDQARLQKIPFFEMIPWITEWVINYELWKKYGVWFYKEIKH